MSYTLRILQEHIKPKYRDMSPKQASIKISVRVPAADHLALCQFASQHARNHYSEVVRKFIHEGLGRGPYLIGNDLDSFRAAAREVWSVGTNFNQLMRAINAGKVSGLSLEQIQRIMAAVNAIEAMKQEQLTIILRSRHREVRHG